MFSVEENGLSSKSLVIGVSVPVLFSLSCVVLCVCRVCVCKRVPTPLPEGFCQTKTIFSCLASSTVPWGGWAGHPTPWPIASPYLPQRVSSFCQGPPEGLRLRRWSPDWHPKAFCLHWRISGGSEVGAQAVSAFTGYCIHKYIADKNVHREPFKILLWYVNALTDTKVVGF